ncbi:MAG: cbb3-type cytochrome c oxidase N-terminal domain-containing protein [Bacteroidia bacterium]|jgi:cytochrome c oxidase cbb3-type subunit III
MAKKHDELTDHEYDGIQEYDNDLPPWWVYLFYLTVVFSIIYLLNYHVFKTAPLQDEEYRIEMARAEKARAAYEASTAGSIEMAFMTGADDLKAGKAIYDANCLACHGANGEGGVGPNLTDAYYIHGNSIEDYVRVITYGVAEKGMIPWEKSLSKKQIIQVSSYIESLYGTEPANAKEPQGELIGQ